MSLFNKGATASGSAAKNLIERGSVTTSVKAAVVDGTRKAAKLAIERPGATAAVGAGILVIAAPAVVAAPALALAGFTTQGVSALSAAAGIQSCIGSVAAGGPFAVLQSAAAGGYGVAIVNGAVQGGGAALASLGGLAGWFGGRRTGT